MKHYVSMVHWIVQLMGYPKINNSKAYQIAMSFSWDELDRIYRYLKRRSYAQASKTTPG